MAFRALIHRDNLWRRFWLLLWHAPRHGQWFSKLLVRAVSAGVLIPLLMVWWNPQLLPYAAAVFVLVSGVIVWWQWSGISHLVPWVGAGLTFLLYWASQFVWWLFLEQTGYRLLFLILVAVCSAWYMDEWHRVRQKLLIDEPVVSSAPTMVLGFLTALAIGTVSQSLVVYLDVSLWWLLLTMYVPLALSFIAMSQACGWRPFRNWRHMLTSSVVLLEVFVLVTWWPTSVQVVGFTLAGVYLLIALVIQQEAQGFLNRRALAREVGVVAAAVAFVLMTARWY